MQSWRGEPYDGSALSKGPDRKSEDRTVMTESISGVGSILAINGGSSTLKFALFCVGVTPIRELSGSIDRIGHRKERSRGRVREPAPLNVGH